MSPLAAVAIGGERLGARPARILVRRELDDRRNVEVQLACDLLDRLAADVRGNRADVIGRAFVRGCVLRAHTGPPAGSRAAGAGVTPSAGYEPSSFRNGALRTQLRQRRGDGGIFAMAEHVDEEQVFPQPGPRRTRLDPRHRNAVPCKRLEQRVHRTGPVRRGHHERRLVAPGRRHALPAEHPEPGRVVRLVLDVRSEHTQTVDRRGDLAGNRRRAGLLRGEPRRLGVARHRNSRRTRQVSREPLRALRQRLRVRIDLAYSLDGRFLRQEVLLDAQLDFAADRKLGRIHEVERPADGTLGRVLDGNDGVIRLARLAGAKDLVDGCVRQCIDELSEMLADCCVTERARGTEIGNSQLLLECKARRHHLAEHADDRGIRQRSAVLIAQPGEDLSLAVRPVRGAAAACLQRADGLGMHRTLVEPAENFAIEDVDRVAVHAQPIVELVVAGVARRSVSHGSLRIPASSPSAQRHPRAALRCTAMPACRRPRDAP